MDYVTAAPRCLDKTLQRGNCDVMLLGMMAAALGGHMQSCVLDKRHKKRIDGEFPKAITVPIQEEKGTIQRSNLQGKGEFGKEFLKHLQREM